MIPDTGRLAVSPLPASSPPIAQRLGRLQWFERTHVPVGRPFDSAVVLRGLWSCRDTHAPACAVVAQVVDIDGACAWRVRNVRRGRMRWTGWSTARNVEEAKASAWWACIWRVW